MADAPDQPADDIVETTAPPEVQEGTGIALDGGYPVNLRLRAEALSKAGEKADPLSHVSPEAIAEAGARLAAEAKDAAAKVPSMRWERDDLIGEATRLGVTIETDANKATILAAIKAATPATNEG